MTKPADRLLLTPSQREALLVLMRALLEHGSVVAITGAAGVGKTTVLRSVMSGRATASTQLIWCDSKDGEPLTLARILLDVAGRLPAMDADLDVPGAAGVAAGASIIVVDDAHLLTPEAASYLVSLLDYLAGKAARVQLVLIGRPALQGVLRSAGIASRISASGEVTGAPPNLAAPGQGGGVAPDEAMPVAVGKGALPVLALPPHRVPPETWTAIGRWPSFGRMRARLGRLASFRAESITEIRVLSGAVVLAVGSLAMSQLVTPAARLADAPTPADAIIEPPSAIPYDAAAALPAARHGTRPTPPRPDVPAIAGGRSASASAPPMPRSKPDGPPASSAAPPPLPAAIALESLTRDQDASLPLAWNDTDRASVHRDAHLPTAEIDALLRSGEALLARGEIRAARLLYERAAAANSAVGAATLGKTYDPFFLASIGPTTYLPKVSLAVAWYRRAVELGDREAVLRLQRLGSLDAIGDRS